MSCLPFQLDIATVGLSVVYALNMRPERVRCTVVATLNIYLAVSFIRGQITKTYSTDTWTRGERGKSKPVFVRTRRFALSYCFGDGEDGKTDVSAIPRYKTTPSVTVVLFFIFLDRARLTTAPLTVPRTSCEHMCVERAAFGRTYDPASIIRKIRRREKTVYAKALI